MNSLLNFTRKMYFVSLYEIIDNKKSVPVSIRFFFVKTWKKQRLVKLDVFPHFLVFFNNKAVVSKSDSIHSQWKLLIYLLWWSGDEKLAEEFLEKLFTKNSRNSLSKP